MRIAVPRRRILVAGSLAGALALAIAGGLQHVESAWAAQQVVNHTMQVPAAPVADPCAPGALVNLHGLIHTVVKYSTDARGGYQTSIHVNTENVSGERITVPGAPTVAYRSTETSETTAYIGSGVTYTERRHFALLSQAATDNFELHYKLHVRFDGGVPTVTATDYRLECRG